MPGVALLPNNPPSAPSHTPTSSTANGQRLPNSSTSGGPGYADSPISVADIKNKAKEGVHKEARGFSAVTLIRSSRTQVLLAKDYEAKGDLRAALGSYIKAATLAKMAMDSPEYIQESKGKNSTIRRELNDLLANDARDISARTNAVEEKLKAIEKAQAAEAKEQPVGASIADRLRALQDNGLSLGPTKLRDRDSYTSSSNHSSTNHSHNNSINLPTPPAASPHFPSVPQSPYASSFSGSNSAANASSSSSSSNYYTNANANAPPLSPSISASTSTSSQSIHALVNPNSFGPPSPLSTPSSSPTTSSVLKSSYPSTSASSSIGRSYSSSSTGGGSGSSSYGSYNYDKEISGFNQAFPSIDELDEDPAFNSALATLPSVPSGLPGAGASGSPKSNTSTSTSTSAYANLPAVPSLPSKPSKEFRNSSSNEPTSPSPLAAFRNFTVPIERPSSTPISPTAVFAMSSRPPSPSGGGGSGGGGGGGYPMVNNRSTAPHRPSGLSNGISSTSTNGTPTTNASGSGSGKPRTPIPVRNTAFPRELQMYLQDHNVLVVDVRTREEFDREHIRANAVVCVEPSVLMRDGVDAEALEQSMVIGPKQELSLFANRDKFDLVAVYDASSTSFASSSSSHDSPLGILVRVIFERAFRKVLKRMPMMLVGGLEAWKREIGEVGLIRGSGSTPPGAGGVGMDIQKPVPTKPVGVAQSYSSGGVAVNMTGQQQHEVWTPPQQQQQQHRVSMSVDQSGHTRAPADTGYNGASGSDRGDKNLQRRPAMLRPSSGSISFSRSLNDGPSSSASGMGTTVPGSVSVSASTSTSTSTISYPQFARHISSPPVSASGGYSPSPVTVSSAGVVTSANITSTNPFISPPPTSVPSPSPYAYPSQYQYDIASPPQASINPSLSRRRSDYIDQSQEALSFSTGGGSSNARAPMQIDYPDLSAGMGGMSISGMGSAGLTGMGMGRMGLASPPPNVTIPRPPPVAAPPSERQDNRPRVQQITGSSLSGSGTGGLYANGSVNGSTSALVLGGPKPPRIASDYPVAYWPEVNVGTSGLKNLGNTCYMNAPIQCLNATVPFSRFFTEGRWKSAVNYTNPLGTKGKLTGVFAKLLHEMWGGDSSYIVPTDFRQSICQLKSQYKGSEQHDSQEFLSFLIDGIHEDLNRIIAKPTYTPSPEEEAELERLPPQIASDREWRAWRSRNDSLIVDFFQGQFRNRLECLTCHTTSTTYNVFSILQLPIPHARSGKVPIEKCLDAFFNEEVLEKDDAWDCPKCKTKRRASKKLSLARLPPILMIHLKRFEANGRFSDKVDTFVDFPMKSLDLTNYMPPPLAPDADRSQLNGGQPLSLDDPRTQLPPYRLALRIDTAFIASRGGWMYCDDSSVKPVDPKQVVNQKAYVLFYKRVRP
ncbi:Ubiquitin carboxyl-terminal hydrolase 4 [Psilocybe cubensis]|uniref:Ubiquitin carboxyl-terminal hydrolase 4 n=1 Tax=Psilocybe cubensis TaxID=181762 RepID=A0ACB8GW92_PSICU|nr:Ubiquitin carboxyl-terminal hydrolase 4 [Psilocybe cubensis]KAH9479240.1 Ubiquitin carboxyl-terminal hydrolase 4 [Psilocybe cubensis]